MAALGARFIGGTLGRALAASGHDVTFRSHTSKRTTSPSGATASVRSVEHALGSAEVVILALPAPAVAELAARHSDTLDGKLVINATNGKGRAVAKGRAEVPHGVRYARRSTLSAGRTWPATSLTPGG